jgi:hypothetical protein
MYFPMKLTKKKKKLNRKDGEVENLVQGEKKCDDSYWMKKRKELNVANI